jgi:hypothetical protein
LTGAASEPERSTLSGVEQRALFWAKEAAKYLAVERVTSWNDPLAIG